MADYYLSAIIALISTAVPGLLLMLPFAKRAKMQLPVAIGFGIAAGIVLVPLLGFAESLVGVSFTSTIAILNVAALSLIGAFLCIREKVFSEMKPAEDAKAFLFANWHWFALLAILLLAFWMRSLSSQPYIYETDPYFYLRATQFISQDGSIPATDNLAWYPDSYTHRERPLTSYLTAGWYMLANPGAAFDKEALYTAAASYPPLVAALAAFMIFAIVYLIWGERWGLVAAALFAFTPVTAVKFAAGVVEQQPWGIFALLFFAAAYCLYLKKGGRLHAALASLALLAAVLGSKQDVFAIFIFAAFLSLQSLRDFLSGKMKKEFLAENAIIAAGGLIGVLMMLPYRAQGITGAGALLAAIGFSALLFAIARFDNAPSRRVYYPLALAAIAFLALVITPAGPWLARTASDYIFSQGLISIIPVQEQTLRDDLGLQLGTIGSFGLPLLILAASATLLAFAVIGRDSKARLLVLVLLPLALLGYIQGKFFLHLATILAIALAALLGEAENYVRPAPKKEESAALAFSVNMASGQAEEKTEPKPQRARYLPLLVLAIGVLAVAAQALPVLSDVSAGFSGSYASEGGGWNCTKLAEDGKSLSSSLLCSKIAPDWTAALGWLAENGGNSSVLAWWDYGHWINYIGQSPAQLRGDLAAPAMVADAAVIYTVGTPQELASYMRERHIKYVILDAGLLQKWQAISYISCYGRNLTQAAYGTGNTSACEQELQFEYLVVPLEGQSASDICDLNGTQALRVRSSFNQTYCLLLPGAGAENVTVLPVFFENGTRLQMGEEYVAQAAINGRLSALLLAVYNASSWDYRQGKAYDSVFYQGLLLRSLPGLKQVYPEPGQPGSIVIFELETPT